MIARGQWWGSGVWALVAAVATATLVASCGGDAASGGGGASGAPSTAVALLTTAAPVLPSAGGALPLPSTAGAGSPRATEEECARLKEISREFGRELLEKSVPDPASRAAILVEMDRKLEEFAADYTKKCTAQASADVACLRDALERRDTVALASCRVDLAELEPPAE